jgi:uncharacterized protein YecT (DUF1311 family)
MPYAAGVRLYAICIMACIAVPATSRAQSQAEMNQQALAEYREADQRLNAVYRDLMAKVSPAGQAKLREAQRAWLRFRDLECAFATAGTADGSVHPMILSGCLAGLTVERIGHLEAQLNCQEGNLSCGSQ